MSAKYLPLPAKFFIWIIFAGIITSCGGEKKQEEADASEEFDAASEELNKKVESVIYEIPSPSEIPYIIENTGAEFNPNLVNDEQKFEEYMVSQQKAGFNLGVYATDIGYLSSYGKTQEALNYFDVCMKLSEYLGIQDAIDMELVQRFENNLANTDSLGEIIDQTINNSEKYLQQNERNNIAALVIGGTFIEGLYIATQMIDTYPKDLLPDDARIAILTPLISNVLKQEEPLANMISLLKSVENRGDWVEATINSLEELHETYQTFNPEEKIKQGEGHQVLDDKALGKLTKQIASIRENVVY